MAKQPFVINVILNTSRREDTLACLASLARSSYQHQRTIVLDNASTDGSVEAIQAQFPAVEIVHLADNRGYAGNNNVGIDLAMKQGADWVFVLNEDIVLAPDCLEELIRTGESDPKIGIVGPMVYHHNEPDIIQSAGGMLDRNWKSVHAGINEVDHNQYPDPRPVDWISGCAILVRRQVIEQVNGLDETFFYYWEETEWCLRTRKAGWQIWHVPGAKIWHKGVQRNYQPSANVTYYSTRNHLMMMAKHHAPLSVWARNGFDIARTLISWSVRPKWRAMGEHRRAIWQGMRDFLQRRHGMRSA